MQELASTLALKKDAKSPSLELQDWSSTRQLFIRDSTYSVVITKAVAKFSRKKEIFWCISEPTQERSPITVLIATSNSPQLETARIMREDTQATSKLITILFIYPIINNKEN
jgi:hypothetical protein